MNPLPILLSIPHGGTKNPEELDSCLCITERDLFDDSDPFVIELYDLGNKVQRVVKTDIARAFVDLNRSLHDLPPKNPDGLIKSMTCYEKPIYIKGQEPDKALSKLLIEKYYMPYHRQIQRYCSELDLQVCLDCHSMASSPPKIAPDVNYKKRPAFCLSNQNGTSSSNELMYFLAECISDSFSISKDKISFNEPFKGGHITKTYGNNPIPWIQIEMNRELYLSKDWFDEETLSIDNTRLQELNEMFEKTLNSFAKNWV